MTHWHQQLASCAIGFLPCLCVRCIFVISQYKNSQKRATTTTSFFILMYEMIERIYFDPICIEKNCILIKKITEVSTLCPSKVKLDS